MNTDLDLLILLIERIKLLVNSQFDEIIYLLKKENEILPPLKYKSKGDFQQLSFLLARTRTNFKFLTGSILKTINALYRFSKFKIEEIDQISLILQDQLNRLESRINGKKN